MHATSALPLSDEHERLRRLGFLAAGMAHEISTPMQYVGDNARFLSEAIGDLRGILTWYQACLRVLAGKRHPELLTEIDAMERKVDLGQLLDEIPLAIAQSLEGIARVSTITRAFKDFCETGAEPIRIDVASAVAKVLEVTQNCWRSRADFRVELGELPRIVARPRDLDVVLVDVILAVTDHCGGAGEMVVVTCLLRPKELRLCFGAADPYLPHAEEGLRGEPCDLTATRSVLARMGGGLVVTGQRGGWSFQIVLPIADDHAGPGAWS